ncbi:MAG: GNAT family N-acetyltransferase [Candidatus Kariarchaeaceae archaeon]|jgi:GNAT superfamily N-acetyltransferase
MEIIAVTSKSPNDPLLIKVAELLHLKDKEIKEHAPLSQEFFILRETASPRPTYRRDHYLLRENEVDIGLLGLRYHLISDREQLGFDVYILPEYRGKGFAKEALHFTMSIIPEEIKIVSMWYLQNVDREPHVMATIYGQKGLQPVYHERINISDISTFDADEIRTTARQLEEEAAAKGYRLYHAEDGNFEGVPMNFEQYVSMVGRVLNDMPSEDASWEEEPMNEEILNALYTNVKELGGMTWTVVALNDTNEPAGLTEVFVYKSESDLVDQGDTGVDRKHRGNGLGRALKYAMLDKLLSDPRLDARYWMTGNANSNEHMLRINTELGYRHCYSEYDYEVPVDKIREYLDKE